MREYEVDGDKHCMYAPIGMEVYFSIVSAPRHGSKQVRELASCRDYISDCIIAAANAHHYKNGETNSLWKKSRNAPVDFGHLRLLIYKKCPQGKSKAWVESRVFSAKRIINMYEDFAGWPGRSTIKRVKHSVIKPGKMWILVGPARWMRATQLVSMVTLIFRVVLNNGGFSACENLDQVEDRFKQLIEAHKEKSTSSWGDLGRLLPQAWPKFRTIMTQFDKLFWNKPKEFWYPHKGVGGWHSQGGIHSMCCGLSTIDHIRKVIAKL